LEYRSRPATASAQALLEALPDDRAILAHVLQQWVSAADEVEGEVVAALLAAARDVTPAALSEPDLRDALLESTRHRLAQWVTSERAWPYALSKPPINDEIEFVLRRRTYRDGHDSDPGRRSDGPAGSGYHDG
jgi:hypothetical protein